MDFNDEEPSALTAKPAFKFQPKPKAKARAPPPKKVISAAKPSIPRQDAEDQLVASPTKAEVPNNGISDDTGTNSGGVKSTVCVEQTTNLQTSSSVDPLLSSLEKLSTISSGNMEENANSKNAEASAGVDSGDGVMPQSVNVLVASFAASTSYRGEDTTGFPVNQEQLSCKGSVAFSNVGDIHMERAQLENKEEQASTSLDFMFEAGASSGKKASTFQPKLKQKRRKKTNANESASDPTETSVVPSETLNTHEGSFHGGSPDYQNVRADDAFSTNPHNDCLLNQVGSLEASPDFIPDPPSCTDATTDCLLNQLAELPQTSSGLIHDIPSQQNATPSEHMHSQSMPVVSEAENNKGQNEEKSGSKKRKSSCRSTKNSTGSDKSVRKHKKTAEASEKSNEQPPKKFPHSTRRRNRCVNKSLLEIPEDEIDYLRLPIRDLILLAEHRERQNKEVNAGQPVMPATESTSPAPVVEPVKERASNDLWNDNPYDYDDDDDVYNSGQAEGSVDNPSTSTAARDSAYFNYHSHMHRTPRVKWSKQETELFYEGLRQFGSDLSMILNLFPGRTRQQIKLKYKKEERQQPMKLLDALANRAKDFSHYKLVIGRLQEQIDREEEQQRAEEEALGATGNEGSLEEGRPADVNQDETAKFEQTGDDGLGAVEDVDEGNIGSPAASSDNELDAWNEYKSEI